MYYPKSVEELGVIAPLGQKNTQDQKSQIVDLQIKSLHVPYS